MKAKLFCTLLILSSLVGCDKTRGRYFCIKNDTQHEIKIEHVGVRAPRYEFHLSPDQEYRAFYASVDFETLPTREDTFYIFMNNMKYMDIDKLKISLTHSYDYVFDTTKEVKSSSCRIFSVNKEYIDSLIEIE